MQHFLALASEHYINLRNNKKKNNYDYYCRWINGKS